VFKITIAVRHKRFHIVWIL